MADERDVIVRGRHVLAGVGPDGTPDLVADGGVLVRGGAVARVGPFGELAAANPGASVLGTGREMVVPGLVNAHHHVGLTPVQLGSPDMPLELWWITRLVLKAVDPYLDTLYSAMEMIGSGVTTATHIQGWVRGGPEKVLASARRVVDAYADIGMRVSHCLAVREQNRLIYMDDDAFCATLPEHLRDGMRRIYDDLRLGLGDYLSMFSELRRAYAGRPRIAFQLAPGNLHWCTDEGLQAIWAHAEAHDVPVHMHLLETPYQKEYALRRCGTTAVRHLRRLGVLGPRLTLGHGVWLTEDELDLVAEAGVCLCHNCSSNFRLRSGVAPLNAARARGVRVAIGIDEAGMNDDRDMLLEMRLVLRAHRTPGMGDDVPSPAEVFAMATRGGAGTTNFGDRIGSLAPGAEADLAVFDFDAACGPYLDALTPPLDALVQRAKPEHVRAVMVGGEVVYRDGRFARVSREDVLAEIHRDLGRALSPDEEERRRMAGELLPVVRAFYERYVDFSSHRPYAASNSRV